MKVLNFLPGGGTLKPTSRRGRSLFYALFGFQKIIYNFIPLS